MKRYFLSLLAAMLLPGITVVAQSVPEIRFDSDPGPLKFPDNIHLGEAAGVATDSKGDIFVYTRTGHPTTETASSLAKSGKGSTVFWLRNRCAWIRRTTFGSWTRCRTW